VVAAELVGDLVEAGAGCEAERAVEAVREVGVAEAEPGLVAECAQAVDQPEAIAARP
jgi:hypothetical protein